MKKKVVVIGAGAAGYFCAVNVAQVCRDIEVSILEKTSKVLSKVRVSGGGRCNVTHACFSIAEMINKYPRGEKFLKQSFHHFFTTNTIQWFEERNIKLKTEADGRMFPVSNTSETIVNCLIEEALSAGVKLKMNKEVLAIESKKTNDDDSVGSKYFLYCKDGERFEADFICIACGGYAKAESFYWLTELGHTFETPVPSLFTFNIPKHPISSLMGISIPEVSIKINGTKYHQGGPLLITHWGLSGPAVLKLSAFAARQLAEKNYDFSISVNWLPAYNENRLLEKLQHLRNELAAQKIINRNPFLLPSRLWQFLLQECQIPEELKWRDLPAKQRNLLAKQLSTYTLLVKGKTTFKEEFVTAGGITLSEVNAGTMESKKCQNIFFAGEILNVDGITGGFNFQHAWTSGWIAAKTISEKTEN
ncbi:NAD(P)/FAD-dependent oxidoreductase [soil metagenome]